MLKNSYQIYFLELNKIYIMEEQCSCVSMGKLNNQKLPVN